MWRWDRSWLHKNSCKIVGGRLLVVRTARSKALVCGPGGIIGSAVQRLKGDEARVRRGGLENFVNLGRFPRQIHSSGFPAVFN